MLTMLTFLVNGSPFSIDIDQVLRVSLLRNHDFIGTKQRKGTGTIIFDELVCPYLGGDAPICLVLGVLKINERFLLSVSLRLQLLCISLSVCLPLVVLWGSGWCLSHLLPVLSFSFRFSQW